MFFQTINIFIIGITFANSIYSVTSFNKQLYSMNLLFSWQVQVQNINAPQTKYVVIL